MKIVIVGACVRRQDYKLYKSLSVAGNKMLLGFAEGFVENGCSVEVVSVTPRAMRRFKKNGEPLFQKEDFYTDNLVDFNIIKYCNFIPLKQRSIRINIGKKLKKIIKNHKKTSEEEIVVCVYNTFSYFVRSVIKYTKKFNVLSCGIIADMPTKNIKKGPLRKIEDRLQEKYVSKLDVLVPLTKQIAEDFAPNSPYLVVEAGLDVKNYANLENKKKNNSVKKVVFSGSLDSLSGIQLALDAFKFIDSDEVVFNVYGRGKYSVNVEEASKADKRIKYCGVVDNQSMLKLQREADLLICPRLSDDYTTKYTFPSKVLEYICAGVPVLCNKLEGIPDEYTNYIEFAANEKPETWAQKMLEILSDKEGYYYKKAQLAKQTVFEIKTWKTQTAKVKKFLETNLV